jgi:hypothetical protein
MYFIYRVCFKNYFLNGAPLDTAESTSNSGWMTNIGFVHFIEHFIEHVWPSMNNKVVLYWITKAPIYR